MPQVQMQQFAGAHMNVNNLLHDFLLPQDSSFQSTAENRDLFLKHANTNESTNTSGPSTRHTEPNPGLQPTRSAAFWAVKYVRRSEGEFPSPSLPSSVFITNQPFIPHQDVKSDT